MEDLVYCKKNYLEFKKGNYYYCMVTFSTSAITSINDSNIFILKENGVGAHNIRQEDFYEHFLSYEKTKRKLKLDRIKKNIKNNGIL